MLCVSYALRSLRGERLRSGDTVLPGPILSWRDTDPLLEQPAEMRGTVETPGKTDIRDGAMHLDRIS